MADPLALARSYAARLQQHYEIGRELLACFAKALEGLDALEGLHAEERKPRRCSRYPGDAALIDRGVEMVLSGEAGSPNEAAMILAATLQQGHSLEATRDRLGRAIR